MRVLSMAFAAVALAACSMPSKPPATTASNASETCRRDRDVTGSHIAGSSTCNDGSVRVMSADSLARQTGGGAVGGGGH